MITITLPQINKVRKRNMIIWVLTYADGYEFITLPSKMVTVGVKLTDEDAVAFRLKFAYG